MAAGEWRPGRTRWTESPQWFDAEPSIPATDFPAHPCTAWAAATGDAGWAGQLAATALAGDDSVYLLVSPQHNVLPLFVEAISLLPSELRGRVSFNTFFTKLPGGIDCLWRGVIAGSPEATTALQRGFKVLDLTKPLGPAPAGEASDAARFGRTLAAPKANPATASPIGLASVPANSLGAGSQAAQPWKSTSTDNRTTPQHAPNRRRTLVRGATFLIGIIVVLGVCSAGLLAIVRWQEERSARQAEIVKAEEACRAELSSAEKELNVLRGLVANAKPAAEEVLRIRKRLASAESSFNLKALVAQAESHRDQLSKAINDEAASLNLPEWDNDLPFYRPAQLFKLKASFDALDRRREALSSKSKKAVDWLTSQRIYHDAVSDLQKRLGKAKSVIESNARPINHTEQAIAARYDQLVIPADQLRILSGDSALQLTVLDEAEQGRAEAKKLQDEFANISNMVGELGDDLANRQEIVRDERLGILSGLIDQWNQQIGGRFDRERKEWRAVYSKRELQTLALNRPNDQNPFQPLETDNASERLLDLGSVPRSATVNVTAPLALLRIFLLDGERLQLSFADASAGGEGRGSGLGTGSTFELVEAPQASDEFEAAWEVKTRTGELMGEFQLRRKLDINSQPHFELCFAWSKAAQSLGGAGDQFRAKLLKLQLLKGEKPEQKQVASSVYALRQPMQFDPISLLDLKTTDGTKKSRISLPPVEIGGNAVIEVEISSSAPLGRPSEWKNDSNPQRTQHVIEVVKGLECHLELERQASQIRPFLWFTYQMKGKSETWSWEQNTNLTKPLDEKRDPVKRATNALNAKKLKSRWRRMSKNKCCWRNKKNSRRSLLMQRHR